jgi:hypothetical protein
MKSISFTCQVVVHHHDHDGHIQGIKLGTLLYITGGWSQQQHFAFQDISHIGTSIFINPKVNINFIQFTKNSIHDKSFGGKVSTTSLAWPINDVRLSLISQCCYTDSRI